MAGAINTEKFPRGVHHFKIITSDFAKNTTQVSGVVVFSKPYEISLAASNGSLSLLPAPESLDLRFRIYAKTFLKRKIIWKQYNVPSLRQPFDYSKIARISDVLKVVALDSLGSPSIPRFIYPRKTKTLPSGYEFEQEVIPEFVRFFLRTKVPFVSPPLVVVSEGSNSRKILLSQSDDNLYSGTFRPQEGFSGNRTLVFEYETGKQTEKKDYDLNLQTILSTRYSEIRFDGGNLIVLADSGSVFRTTFLEIQKLTGRNKYSFLPRFAIMDRGLTVKMKSQTGNTNQAIYFRGRSKRWSLSQTERSGEYLVARLDKMLGDVAVMSDSKPPTISRLSVPSRNNKLPHIVSFRVSDNLSGVEYKELKLYIDGEFVVPEIDGEHRRVVNKLAEPLQRGPHTIRIQLKDRMGNAREVQRSFKVR